MLWKDNKNPNDRIKTESVKVTLSEEIQNILHEVTFLLRFEESKKSFFGEITF